MADLLLDTVSWVARNRNVDVYLEEISYRVYNSAAYPTDDTQPMLTASGVPQRNFAPDTIITQFPDGSDTVKVFARSAIPYAEVVREAGPGPVGPGDIVVGVSFVNDGAPNATATLTVTTTGTPFYTWLDNGTPTLGTLNYSVTHGQTYGLHIRNSRNEQLDTAFTVPTFGGGTPGGRQIRQWNDEGRNKTETTYYEALPDRRVYKVTTPIDPAQQALGGGQPTDGITPGAELDRVCEGTDLVVFYASNVTPWATFAVTPNSTECGYTPVPVRGCTDPNATNYNPAATEDDGSCQYSPPDPTDPQLVVMQSPSDWAPVHLPVLLTLTAQPDEQGEPRPVLCFIDASDDDGETWDFCGSIRRIPGGNKLVQFNLSEYLKARFAIIAPAAGLDRSLSLRWRVRIGFGPLYLGEEGGEELLLDTLHVVNGAAPNGGLGAYLSDLIALPAGYPYLLSKISGAGVNNTTTLPGAEAAICPPYPLRLAWLNQRGGWNSFVFSGKHEYGTDAQGGTVYEDITGAQRFADRGEVRNTVKVFSDRLLPSVASSVRTIRTSIQIYAIPSSGDPVAVLIEEGSFSDYRAGDKSPTVDFVIRYPRLTVQTQ